MVCRRDDFRRYLYRSFETEGLFNKAKIIVDRFWYATMLIFACLRLAVSAIACAPFKVPSPPMQNRILIPFSISSSTISSGSWLPREDPSMVPPCL